MGNLASTYSELGRHSEALAMKESVLEFTRRVLPAEHPDIGEGRVWSAAALAPYTHFCIRFSIIPHQFMSRGMRRAAPCAAGCCRGAAHIACLRPAARSQICGRRRDARSSFVFGAGGAVEQGGVRAGRSSTQADTPFIHSRRSKCLV